MFQNKTIQVANPFETLKFEQAKWDFELDFRILDFVTFGTKKFPQRSKIYTQDELEVFYADDFFVKNYDVIYQEFKIEIFTKIKNNPFKFALKTNANLTLLKVCLDYENFELNLDLKEDLRQALYQTLIKHKILIIRLDKELEDNLDKCVRLLKENKAKGFEFVVANGVSEIKHQSAELIFHRNIEEIVCEDKGYDEGDYSKPVKKDELLFEFIHKKLGREGRNLRGELLKIAPSEEVLNFIELKDDSIYVENLPDRLQYFSANYGFLTKDIGGFSVRNSLKVSRVDLKNTGSIKADLNEEVNIEVANKNFNDDAVKSGIVNIKAANVNIEGHIGATKLEAAKLQIAGATHAKSKIYAKTAFIANHKGSFEGDIVFVNNLERGEIKAKNVYVKRCIASRIEADNIFVEDLFMDNKLYPKKNLVILKNIKANNFIKVSPEIFINNECKDEIKELEALLYRLDVKLANLLKQKQNFYAYLVKNQARIIKLRKSENIHNIDVKIMELYEGVLARYEEEVLEYKKLIKLRFEIKRRLKSLSNMVFKAKIYIQSKPKDEDNILEFASDGKSFCLELKQTGFYHLETSGIKREVEYDESEINVLKTPFLEFLQEES
ncbi:FapA family protein [Campylobacter helveticus]|uniref:FapA family protein n=1 Tax=Campylobacter helveticus TaxID=28898 RepID=UPI00214C8CB3|nr:FapA family protein [Campylobacter helveticus]